MGLSHQFEYTRRLSRNPLVPKYPTGPVANMGTLGSNECRKLYPGFAVLCLVICFILCSLVCVETSAIPVLNKTEHSDSCGPVCLILCEHGNKLDSKGGPLCECNSPPENSCGPVCLILCEH